jgi:hypothetical protein
MVAGEYEAIQLYMQLAESTDNKLAIEFSKTLPMKNAFMQESFFGAPRAGPR